MPLSAQAELLRAQVSGFFHSDPPTRIGVAVSGGSDSLAMLYLLKDWAANGGPELAVVTVDHRLRPEAADEAAFVAGICDQLDVSHDILTWNDWDGQGNLPDRARRARYSLIAEWATAKGIASVAVAHTADDQAETFLMRLAREAGVDGLSAMSARWQQGSVEFCRPTLNITRAQLRDVLREQGQTWVDDPSNEDQNYDRVRARKALTALEPLGINTARLGNVAQNLSRVRETLYQCAYQAARDLLGFLCGDVLIDRKGFRDLPGEISRRLLQQVLKWINGVEYAPRGRSVDLLLESIRDGTDMTLQGCHIIVGREQVRVTREAAAAQEAVPVEEVWDGRWKLTGPALENATVAALGEAGLGLCPDRRETGLPARSLMSGPAVWQEGVLIAAPLAGLCNGWRAELQKDKDHLFAALLSH